MDQQQTIRELLAPVLGRVSQDEQPFLLAHAERLAAQRYRRWAQESSLNRHADALEACARREEEIADSIQSLYTEETLLKLTPIFPELEAINQRLFSQLELHAQLALQASGERAGVDVWEKLAEQRSEARDLFLHCAKLEQASADFLDTLL